MIKTAEEESTPRSIPSPERRSRRKFILIDHSIKGFGGHHYEYAVHVLNAAQELGFEPILAVNRAFSRDPDETAPWTTIPVYEFGFWPEPESDESSGLKALKGLAFDLRIRLVYGRIGLFRARLVSLHTSLSTEEAIHRTEQVHLTGGLLIARFLITYPHLVLKSLWQLIRAIFAFIPPGFFRYFRNIGSAFINVIRQAVYPFKVFKLIRGHSHRSRLSVRLKAFERDTRLLFNSRSPVEEGDLVFIPTLSEQDLVSLGRFLNQYAGARAASWHLLFRRNLFTGTKTGYDRQIQDPHVIESRESFRSFLADTKGINTHFYTDTERLTDQYNRLGICPFRTLPIPINSALARHTGATRPPDAPLTITYAGDARKEKGYHLLPELVRSMWKDCFENEKVIFEFQSNFLHARPTDATDERLALSELESFPSEKVRLHRDPLDSDAYFRMLDSADILVIPYDPENYYARSSGILVEALTAGIPVVVPAGSWMEQQIREASYEYCRQIAGEYSALSRQRLADIRWNRSHGNLQTRNGALTFRGKQNCASAFVTPCPGSTHMLVRFDRPENPRREVAVEMNQVRRLGRLRLSARAAESLSEAERYRYKDIDQSLRILSSPLSQNQCATLLELHREIDAVWLGLYNPEHDDDVSLRNLEILFLDGASDGLTRGVVGVAYDDPNTLADRVSEIVRNYADYKHSAEKIAGWWRNRHSARTLVKELQA